MVTLTSTAGGSAWNLAPRCWPRRNGWASASPPCVTCRASSPRHRASCAPCRSKDGARCRPPAPCPWRRAWWSRPTAPDVRAARKMALELLLSDHAGECVAPCAARCPAGLDIPGFVYGIATGDHRRAMRGDRRAPGAARFSGTNLPAPVRGRLPPLRSRPGSGDRRAASLRRRSGPHRRRPIHAASRARYGKVRGHRGRRVRRDLAAAWYLLRKGHACTLFDAHRLPGGMLRYGIPAYRLPKDALDAEIGVIERLGARFQMGARLGPGLHARRAAAGGTTRSSWRSARSARRGSAARARSTRWRASSSWNGREWQPAPAGRAIVVVVGGGNTAMDCARSAVRLGAQNVRILYRRGRQEMPCAMDEVEAAEAEGVHLDFLVAPVRLERPRTVCC